jgi:hypothetical protein
LMGAGHHLTLLIMEELALVSRSEHKYAQAEMLYAKLLNLEERALGREHPKRLASTNDLAFLYLSQREYAKAERLAVTALDAYKNATTDTWHRYESEAILGASLAGQNKYADGEPMLLSGYAGMVRCQTNIPAGSRFKVKSAGTWIVRLYADSHRKRNVEGWREKLRLARSAPGAQ